MEPRHDREFEFELPVGWADPDGVLHRRAVIRKMTGREEALLSDKRNRGSGARMITELLGSCLVRIGAVERPGVKVAQSLYSADRHFLLVKLREITFGPELQGTYSCPTCHAAATITEDLGALEVVRLPDGTAPDDVVVDLEDGYVDAGGAVHTTMSFRAATGLDEEKVAPIIRENPSQGKNALLARCLRSVGDMPRARIEGLGTALFNDLTLKDRAIIDRALSGGGPGVRMRRELSCDRCGRSYSATLDFSNFLALS